MLDKTDIFTIDLHITLRCNQKCINCDRGCGNTSLDYSKSDMSLDQIYKFIHEIEARTASGLPKLKRLFILGGEPFIHPNIWNISDLIINKLLKTELIETFGIVTNLTYPIPSKLKSFIINYSKMSEKNEHHLCTYFSHFDVNKNIHYQRCLRSLEPYAITLSYMGYSLCCPSILLMQLFDDENKFLLNLPRYRSEFHLDPSKICCHCANVLKNPFKEKILGCPISLSFKLALDKIKKERNIRIY